MRATSVIRRGVEANPLLGNLANHPPALVAVKSAPTLVSMRGLSKKHPKAAALAMIGVNVASVLIARSNLKIVARQ